MKKLIAFAAVALTTMVNAQQMPPYYAQKNNGYASQAFQQADVCDYFSQQLIAAFVEGNQTRQPVERVQRYQALRQNQTFSFVNIPKVLSKVKDLEMNGASVNDLYSISHILCNENLRGNNN